MRPGENMFSSPQVFEIREPDFHIAVFLYMPDRSCASVPFVTEKPGGVLGSIFAGYVPLATQNPYPIIVYSVANYRPHLSHFWANVIFPDPNLVTFC